MLLYGFIDLLYRMGIFQKNHCASAQRKAKPADFDLEDGGPDRDEFKKAANPISQTCCFCLLLLLLPNKNTET